MQERVEVHALIVLDHRLGEQLGLLVIVPIAGGTDDRGSSINAALIAARYRRSPAISTKSPC